MIFPFIPQPRRHQAAAGEAGAYQPWWISTAFFLLASRDFRRAAVFLCNVPTFTALSITEYASAMSFSIERTSSDCASGFFLRSSKASKTWDCMRGRISIEVYNLTSSGKKQKIFSFSSQYAKARTQRREVMQCKRRLCRSCIL